ncbi:MAG: cytochrome bc1 complex diheme cytochrome c subunit [Acidimicrobiales bacterium]
MKAVRLALVVAGLALTTGADGHGVQATQAGPQTQPPPTRAPASDVRNGRDLFQVACSSCHGLEGEGTEQGPTLIGVGAASADFYLATGRMPLDNPDEQATRKEPAYSPLQIRQLVAYVTSLGPGPPIPTVNPAAGDIALGSQLYANNCAPCHSSAGAGGALGHSVYAPRLDKSTPTEVAEAVRIGPGAMPVFGRDAFDEEELAAIVRYVEYLKDPADPGGLGLGHLGPIPEGFVAWVVGLGLIVVAIRWIGTRD